MLTGEYPSPTRRERCWVRVGWPSNGVGLWVIECDNDNVFGPRLCDDDVGIPDDAGQLLLARNMDERCSMLEEFGGEFFASVEEYQGLACLNAWKKKTTGEIGPLVVTRYKD